MYFFRLAGDTVVQYAAVRDDLGMMQQFGLIPAPATGRADERDR